MRTTIRSGARRRGGSAFTRVRRGTWSGAREPVSVLRGLVAPESAPWLTSDLQYRIDEGKLVPGAGSGFQPQHLADTVIGLYWLAYHLPPGDPARTQLPVAYDLLRQRLANPALLLPLLQAGELDGLRQVYGLPTVPSGPNQPVEVLPLGDAGYLVSGRYGAQVYAHPAALDTTGAPLLALAHTAPGHLAAALLEARSGSLARLIEEIRAEAGAGSPGRPHNPLVSVPGLVAEVEQRHGLEPGRRRSSISSCWRCPIPPTATSGSGTAGAPARSGRPATPCWPPGWSPAGAAPGPGGRCSCRRPGSR
ncbi:hypothetical protein KIH74_24650 [Kineosporia sp. J2-2]|uniref:Uncharacterized protein n=1 Tax=Kineosporia corallincola TaxID=2835133 RepID=A0ABS5TM23_9ACTN|nr:hypothetical protein [Kineosporia corallincola]MBT0772157.1 hypothetical protein [Kineosporia corallincola]